MPKPTKLTAKVLASLQPGERVRDTVVRGLFAECGVRGVSLKVQADLRQPGQPVRTVKQTLGHQGPELSLDAARAQAQGLLSTIKSRVDPRALAAEPAKLTVRAMFEAYSADLRARGGAESSIQEHAYLLTKYLPALAERAVADVKPSELRAEHARIAGSRWRRVSGSAGACPAACGIAGQSTATGAPRPSPRRAAPTAAQPCRASPPAVALALRSLSDRAQLGRYSGTGACP